MKKWIRPIATTCVLLCFAVLALAIQREGSRNNPQPCGSPAHASLLQQLGLFTQNAPAQPCETNIDGTCANPGNRCVDPATGTHGKCVTSGTTCTCQHITKGGKKKGGKR